MIYGLVPATNGRVSPFTSPGNRTGTRSSSVLPLIERELAPFSARPHWGKLFTMSPSQLKPLYEKLPEFVQLSNQFDPTGKFRNEFLNTYVF